MKLSGMSWKNGTVITNGVYDLEITDAGYTIKKPRFRVNLLVFFLVVDIGIFALSHAMAYAAAATGPDDLIVPLLAAAGIWAFNIWIFWRILGPRMREWHGLEHKLIHAAEHGDIENAAAYSTIHDRCGGTYFLTMPIYLYLSWVVSNIVGLGGEGILTMTALLVMLESRTFHHYNIPGIWLGRFLQRFTTREPGKDLLERGIPAMAAFMGVVG